MGNRRGPEGVEMIGRSEGAVKAPHEARRGGGLDGLADDQLLEVYLDRRDEGAFEAMVTRHGPRVLSVCRQVLGRSAEVEDVFQSAFLLLATRAESIRNRESLGAWLQGVAHRMAVRSKARAARRAVRERRAVPVPPSPSEDDMDLPQLRLVLHGEIDRLPDRLRLPILMCYLEGRTNEEAARILGCPSGTLKDRLARGRDVLRGRLARRGIALTAAILLLLLPGTVKAEEVPPWLVAATVEAARGRALTGRRGKPATPIRLARVATAAAVAALLVAIVAAWVLFGPSPARGSWMRWMFDLTRKVCQ